MFDSNLLIDKLTADVSGGRDNTVNKMNSRIHYDCTVLTGHWLHLWPVLLLQCEANDVTIHL